MDLTPGKQSTEFWLALATMVIFLANGTEFVTIPWDQFPYLMALAGAYGASRSWVKTSAIKTPKEKK